MVTQQPEKEALRNGVRINHFLVTVRAKHNFNGRDPEDLSFRKGEMLNVVEKHEPQWWKAQSQDTLQIGVIPSNYVDQYALGPIEIAKKEAIEAAKKRAEYEAQASAKVRKRACSTAPLHQQMLWLVPNVPLWPAWLTLPSDARRRSTPFCFCASVLPSCLATAAASVTQGGTSRSSSSRSAGAKPGRAPAAGG